MDVEADLVDQTGLEERRANSPPPIRQMSLPDCPFSSRMKAATSAANENARYTRRSEVSVYHLETRRFTTPSLPAEVPRSDQTLRCCE